MRSAACALSILLLLLAPAARAQTDDATRLAARTLGEAGLTLLEQGDYAGALEKFDKALALVQVPTLGVRSARCLVKLGRFVEATERYRQVGGMAIDPNAPAAFKEKQIEAQAQAEAERAEVLKRVAMVEIGLQGAAPGEVTLEIDGRSVPAAVVGAPRPMDPGPHRIVARRESDVVAQNLTLVEGSASKVTLVLPVRAARVGADDRSLDAGSHADAGASHGSTQRTLGFVGLGVGAATLGAAGVTFALALGKKSDLDATCSDRVCPESAKDTLDGYNTMRAASRVTLVAGGVLMAAGLVLVLTAPANGGGTAGRKQAWVAPFVATNGAGVIGSARF